MKVKVKVITVKPILTEEQIKAKEGHKFPESHYKQIIKTDADVYGINESGEKQLLLKFRKNVIPNDVCIKAYMALEKHAKHKNHNRGAAAGVINTLFQFSFDRCWRVQRKRASRCSQL